MAKAGFALIVLMLFLLLFISGCSNPHVEDAFSPGAIDEFNHLEPPKEAPFDPTPEPINKSIEDFFPDK